MATWEYKRLTPCNKCTVNMQHTEKYYIKTTKINCTVVNTTIYEHEAKIPNLLRMIFLWLFSFSSF